MKRTGSIGSYVGPAVDEDMPPGERRRGRLAARAIRAMAATMSAAPTCGRGRIRRRPSRRPRGRRNDAVRLAAARRCAAWPDAATSARSSPGRRARACRWPAAWSRRGRRRGHAPSWRENRRWPGATTRRSAERDSSIWPISASSSRLNSSWRTGARSAPPPTAASQSAPPPASARRCTWAPRSRRRRISSSALNAATPPPMTRRMRLEARSASSAIDSVAVRRAR